jgi:hypothetical protein
MRTDFDPVRRAQQHNDVFRCMQLSDDTRSFAKTGSGHTMSCEQVGNDVAVLHTQASIIWCSQKLYDFWCVALLRAAALWRIVSSGRTVATTAAAAAAATDGTAAVLLAFLLTG